MSLQLTEAAAQRVQKLLDIEGDASLHLRVFVSGGGCSGYQYGFAFDDKVTPDDTVVESSGVKLLVDAMSLELLNGSEIDFQSSVQGESFVIRNPNASGTCGCGQSFTPADAGEGCAHAGY
jgi:iron-sulfur cluster insertion protein